MLKTARSYLHSKSCYYHIRELRCIRPYLDFKTASTYIATSIVHSKLDCCNSLYYNLLQSQIKTSLQNIHNSLARAVTRTPKSSHITPFFKSLHWLKVNERIKYKLLSLTYKSGMGWAGPVSQWPPCRRVAVRPFTRLADRGATTPGRSGTRQRRVDAKVDTCALCRLEPAWRVT